jgi:hypothetical protein
MEFLESLAEAAKDIGEISEEEMLRTVRSYRRESRAPEIIVAAERRRRKPRAVIDTSVLVAGISGFRESYVPCRNPSADVLHEWAEKDNFAWLINRGGGSNLVLRHLVINLTATRDLIAAAPDQKFLEDWVYTPAVRRHT